ncbi:LPXTG cell wall anchor domain-containing protein [Listeria cornellensis]|uniref:LPXTG cell wall anchor domain-containing protein n=1 Tax=Listeria cornellensis TaxID=1494961 RepID=UPI00098D008D
MQKNQERLIKKAQKQENSAEKVVALPSTGDNNSLLLMLSGMLLIFVSFFGFKTKNPRRK